MASGDGWVWGWFSSVGAWFVSIQPATWTMIIGTTLSAIPVLWALRKDSWTQGGVRRKERADALRQDEADIRTGQKNILDWHREEVERLRLRIVVIETDRDKQIGTMEVERDTWEARARWWYGRAYDMLAQLKDARHLANNCAQVIANLIDRNGLPNPGLAELTETEPRLPARIESIEDKA